MYTIAQAYLRCCGVAVLQKRMEAILEYLRFQFGNHDAK